MRSSTRSVRLLPLAMAAVIALGACNDADPQAEFTDPTPSGPAVTADPGDGDAPADSASPDDSAPVDAGPHNSGSSSTEGTAPPSAVAATAAPIGADRPPDGQAVVARDTFTVPGTRDQRVEVGIESIVVSGPTMELRLIITPLGDGDDPVSVYDVLQNGTGVVDATLIDRQHLKEYTVLREAPLEGGRRYETDPVAAAALPGEPIRYQMFYAAPEDDLDVVDVKLHDALPVFEDVPVTHEAG